MRSLQSRLGLGLLLSLLTVFFILWLVISNAVRVVAENYFTSRLEHDAESLLAALTPGADGAWDIDKARISGYYKRPFSGHYYRISITLDDANSSENTSSAKGTDNPKNANNTKGPFNANATSNTITLWSRSLWDLELPVPSGSSENLSTGLLPGPQNQGLLARVYHYRKRGAAIKLIVAEDFTPVERDIRKFQQSLALTALVLLALLVLIQMWLLRASLRPVKEAGVELRLLERGELKQLSVHVPDEINPLVTEINRLFAAMTARLQRSRNAIGDLSHALKKPLTVLHQIAADPRVTKYSELGDVFETQINSIGNIINRNLKKARLAGDGPGGANFIVSKDLQELADTIRRMYANIEVTYLLDSLQEDALPYDRDDMLELLGNIIDNAAKWARSIVNIHVSDNRDKLKFVVEDDGPGIPENNITNLLRRGARLDERVEGQGMGLAIAQEIVSHYSGSMIFSRSEVLQGLQVTIELPT